MLWLVPLVPLLAAPLLYGLCRDGSRMRLAGLATAVVLTTFALAVAALLGDWSGSYRWSSQIQLTLALAPASAVFALTVPLVATPIVLYAAHHEAQAPTPAALARLMALLLAFVGAMELLVLAADLLTLLIAWELVGALSWSLIGHDWRERGNLRDAGWAFLVTRFGDLGLYIAAAAAFAGSGSFAFTALSSLEGLPLQVFVAGIVLACAAKSAQLPFAPWLFAAMAGPTSVSALLHAATMVAAGVYLTIRLHPSLDAVAWFAPLAMALGLATALAGGVVAGLQGHAKKLLAASTSAHYGLMWLAVGAGYPGAALLHFVVHAFFKAGLFLASGIAEHQVGSYALGAMRLGRRLPGIAVATLIASLALAGVPPLGGAWSKEQIVSAAGHHGAWLALATMLAGAFSAYYATRLQWLGFGPGPAMPRTPGSRPGNAERLALYLLSAGALLLSLLWWPGLAEAIGHRLGFVLPAGEPWEVLLSWLLVGLGVLGGAVAVRQQWGNEDEANTRHPMLSRWFGLPALATRGASALFAASHALARFDDRVVDGGLRLVARYGSAAHALARFDDRAVDGGVRLTARVGEGLARFGDRRGEALFDGWVSGLSEATGALGRQVRRLQSGQMHHYYTGIAAGLAVVVLILAIGGLP
ncbi:NADH-quinone oxidoreductase subunit 5 family protein [Stutzerimonas balearica]|uniref:NADH-quinone oxidoreductase subunit 5 family protein n=1 Tax=Stutzerimonas balearica TaxID=74829 RepID=UPI00289E618E|nr:proton-conducting transporter membrane subunit [Stutzerimonas balearica]